MIRPGYTVLDTPNFTTSSTKRLYSQNVVSLGAIKITPNENIRSAKPEKRNCFFGDEYQLKAHQNYSQVEAVSKLVIFFSNLIMII